MNHCPICGANVPRRAGRGRPTVYDRPICRKQAERKRAKDLIKLGRAVEKIYQEMNSK